MSKELKKGSEVAGFQVVRDTDTDFIMLSDDTYQINKISAYLAIYLTDSEEDEDNITAYVLVVPERKLWTESALRDVAFAIGMEGEDVRFIPYADMVSCGPKASLMTEVASESGVWEDMDVFKRIKECVEETLNHAKSEKLSVEFTDDGEWAFEEILG